MWVIRNPSLNAVSIPHPRPNPQEGRVDLHLNGHAFAILTDDELSAWRLSPAFVMEERAGRITVEETDRMPDPVPQIPSAKKPQNEYDHQVAREVAFDAVHHDIQMARIELFRDKEDSGREWVENADMTYLRTRHRSMLVAAEWYLEQYVTKRTRDQNARLKAIKAQIKAIDHS